MGDLTIETSLVGDYQRFIQTVKTEVDKANKRLSRMNDFQKRLFEDKGITHISRKGGIDDKLKALAQAAVVNNSGLSTKTEYNNFIKKAASELSMTPRKADWILNQFDPAIRDFIATSPLVYGKYPQIDFLVDDVMEISDSLDDNLDKVYDYIDSNRDLLNEVESITNGFFRNN